MQINIRKRKGSYNDWNIEFKGMTAGKILAIDHALYTYGKQSDIAREISYLLKEIMKSIDGL